MFIGCTLLLVQNQPLLTATEVAELFGVQPSTIARWARDRKLRAVVLPSGHRRYRTEDVQALIADGLKDAS